MRETSYLINIHDAGASLRANSFPSLCRVAAKSALRSVQQRLTALGSIPTMCRQSQSLVLRSAVVLGFAGVFLVPGAYAQVTVAGFTNASGFQDLKIGTNNVVDGYDNGNANSDPTKQNQLNGTNSRFDLVGNASFGVVQIATGTVQVSSVATAAMAFRIRLADFNANNGIKSGSVITLIQNDTSVFGVGLGVTANGGVTLAGITSNTGTTLTASYQYTLGTTISTDAARYSYTQANSAIGGTSDAFVTFVVLASELSTISSGFTFGTNTGVSVFTNSGGSGLGSGNINADFITSDNTFGGSLAFGSTSGSTAPIPEFSTAMILGVMLMPAFCLRRPRRNRTNTANAAN